MELQSTITRENLETLVTTFYHRAMKDDLIGDYFTLELGEDINNFEWVRHIDILVDFWASVFMDDPEYTSDPYGPHFTIVGLQEKDFVRWVQLFSQASEEIYVDEVAKSFQHKAKEYAQEFMTRLKVNPEISEYYNV